METGEIPMFIHFTLKSITKTDSFSSHTVTSEAFLIEVLDRKTTSQILRTGLNGDIRR